MEATKLIRNCLILSCDADYVMIHNPETEKFDYRRMRDLVSPFNTGTWSPSYPWGARSTYFISKLDDVYIGQLDLPKIVKVTIQFKDDTNKSLFTKFSKFVGSLDGVVTITDPVLVTRPDKTKVKQEYVEKVEQIQKEHETHKQEFDELMERFNKLGYNPLVRGFQPKLMRVPDSYYEVLTLEDWSQAKIEILCHSKTKIYEYLVNSGLLMDSLNTQQLLFLKQQKFQQAEKEAQMASS